MKYTIQDNSGDSDVLLQIFVLNLFQGHHKLSPLNRKSKPNMLAVQGGGGNGVGKCEKDMQ